MENTLVILLLLCALSVKSLAQEPKPQSQFDVSEIHAVLRAISAKLAVLQFQLDQQQTLFQAQAAELGGIKTQINKAQHQVETLKRDKGGQGTPEERQNQETQNIPTRRRVPSIL